ncbi:TraB/GumN family protein [Vibrio sp. SCSIO 43132]|uniref:TraB/GumN family protein n=1 Tax=Vibrio sp. SCSIO 43132 TaxID=2779363 RepID=UPI001CAA0886|nr:TraB/GumN family protein [Vibrio sp. SCSIO 43132]UAB69603.1 TraB/GumN family protein [Vibrio sp. SCSIO 43132]
MSLSLAKRLAIALFLIFPLTLKAQEPLFWKVQKDGYELLVIGSIHVGDKSMYPLPKSVSEFLKQSEGLIVEIDLNKPPSGSSFPVSKLKTSDVLDVKQSEKVAEIASSLGLPDAQILSSPPWLSALSLQMANFQRLGYNPADGVDYVLTNEAIKQEKPILPLETASQQLGFLNALPNNGEHLLKETLLHWDTSNDEFHCQIDAWKTGDKSRLMQLLQDGEYDESILDILLYDRNHDWVKQINSGKLLSKEGQYTVVVGTLHLLGKENVLDLLSQSGWKVSQLSTSTPVKC